MMEPNNPYEPPQSEVVHDEQEPNATGVALIPWEDKAAYPGFLEPALATMKLMLRPSLAGPSLGAYKRLGPAITFFLCIGLPLVWMVAILNACFGPADPNAALMAQFNLPRAH